MKTPHLLRVTAPPAEFAPLVQALAQAGARVGWLELTPTPPAPLPSSLEQAASCGVLRAVGLGPGQSVVVKPRRGKAVLRDLLREHFRGCQLVLVSGDAPDLGVIAPLLRRMDEQWHVVMDDQSLALELSELVARLRRPRAWE